MNGKRAKSLRMIIKILSNTIGVSENKMNFREGFKTNLNSDERTKYVLYFYSEFSPRRGYKNIKRMVKTFGLDAAIRATFEKYSNRFESQNEKIQNQEAIA